MRRPRHPLNAELRGMIYNPKSSLYEVEENCIDYGIPLELTRQLKVFAKAWTYAGGEPLIASWYKSLDKVSKKQVTRAGNIPEHTDGFYPDPEFD
ncbi:MAG: hypothetical protein QM763_24860 [Agriterribacter sp.]